MKDRWRIVDDVLIWNVAKDKRLPHADHIEMSGRKVSLIVRYEVDADRNLSLTREVIWPTLRTRPNDVRGYTRRVYGDETMPRFLIEDELRDGRLQSIAGLHLPGRTEELVVARRRDRPHGPIANRLWDHIQQQAPALRRAL